jgi:hypothetical protein
MEAKRQSWKKRCESKAATDLRARQQLEVVVAQKDQAAKASKDAGKAAGHTAAPMDPGGQSSKEAQDRLQADLWASTPAPSQGLGGQGASPEYEDHKSEEWVARNLAGLTKEEAERWLARTHIADSEARELEIQHKKTLLDKLKEAACAKQAKVEDIRKATLDWERTRQEHCNLEDARRKTDIVQQQQAKALQDFYSGAPAQAGDDERARKLTALRKTEEEGVYHRARLAEDTRRLRKECEEADKVDAEAKSKSTRAAWQLAESMAEAQDVENRLRGLQEDIAKEHAEWSKKNELAQKASIQQSWEQPVQVQAPAAPCT